MKAAVREQYGNADAIEIADIEKPTPGPSDVLVRVHAVSLNASDWEFLTGSPAYIRMWGLFKPRNRILGSDIAGTVEAVGAKVTRFQPGDEVLGDVLGTFGGLAEYACAPEKKLTKKPDGLSMVDAATLPQASLVALQGLRDIAGVRQDERVLINGAGGGSGSFAIQIARHLGAHVTGVDRTDKLDFMRSLGASDVIDFTKEDFTTTGKQFDVILDLAAHSSLFESRRALAPGGRYFLVGGGVPRIFEALLFGPFLSTRKRKLGLAVIEANRDLDQVLDLVTAGTLRPIVDRVYALNEAREALGYLGAGNAKGKVVVKVVNVD